MCLYNTYNFALGPIYIYIYIYIYSICIPIYILDIQCFKIKASHFIHLS